MCSKPVLTLDPVIELLIVNNQFARVMPFGVYKGRYSILDLCEKDLNYLRWGAQNLKGEYRELFKAAVRALDGEGVDAAPVPRSACSLNKTTGAAP